MFDLCDTVSPSPRVSMVSSHNSHFSTSGLMFLWLLAGAHLTMQRRVGSVCPERHCSVGTRFE
ncbi:hypothetical protein HSB1_40160 [Halogranum salarium B-1]|uniref:Uncharacterized protein n=1 Tax=Halogranum salarium B-1 TaxID=1210908 RepID=J2ZAG1_9EURY|nr:hypothetical protein HSB1_40160 [Halogranum salarium B-1]